MGESIRVNAVLVGAIRPLVFRETQLKTGIFKTPVDGPVLLTATGLVGDHQGDPRFHGGPDKALYAFSSEAYCAWQELRPSDTFQPGAMGENMTITGLNENQISLGDIFSIGEALIQVTEPRFPCGTLAAKFNDLNILKQFDRILRPGIYFRVLKEGHVQSGQIMTTVELEPHRVSITEMYAFKKKRPSGERLSEILSIKALSAEWRERLQKSS